MEGATNESNASKKSNVHLDHENSESFTAVEADSHVGNDELVIRTTVEMPSIESEEREIIDPYKGMGFESMGAAQRFFNVYAKHTGFRVRVKTRYRSQFTNRVIGLRFVCSKNLACQNQRTVKRRNTKWGCKAFFKVKRASCKKWVIEDFIKEHNHALGSLKDVSCGGSINIDLPLSGCRTIIQGLRLGIFITEVDAHVSEIDGVADSTARLLTDSGRPANLDPCVGMEFESEEAATEFYFKYATCMGFSVCIRKKHRSVCDGTTNGITFVCSKEGFHRKDCKSTQQETREGCMAMLNVKKRKSGKWIVKNFVKEHSHTPTPGVPIFQLPNQFGGCGDAGSATQDLTSSNQPANIEPFVGMEFESEEAAMVIYFKYAACVGFSIRIGKRCRSTVDGATIGPTFLCSKEGFRRKDSKSTRQQTREGCMGMLCIKKEGSGKWTVTKFLKDHCHPLGLGGVPILRSVANQFGGCADTSSTVQDRASHIRNLRERAFGSDAQIIFEYFKHKQSKNATFFYAIDVDEEYRLTNFFWASARSRISYSYFGDVVTFDITYHQNGMPFVLFLGSNHHKQPILFGSALLLDENEASFVWLFNTWLEAMFGCHPFVIISNQEPAVEKAIRMVFPNTQHHYQKQGILKNIPEKLCHVECNHQDLTRDFSKCFNLTDLIDEFESCWKTFIDKYKLRENEWLKLLYKQRRRWVRVYSQETSSADIFTLHGDGTRSFSSHQVNAYNSLQAFVDECEKLIDYQYEKALEEDHKTSYTKPIMMTGLLIENQAAEIYTRKVFFDFQEQLFQSLHCTAEIISEDGPFCSVRVEEFGVEKSSYIVTFNSLEVEASCSCQMFDFAGILCIHVLRVFSMKNVTELPSHYILKRWTRDAITGEFDEGNIEVLGDVHTSWTLRYNDIYHHAIKYAREASANLNIYYVATRDLHKALENVVSATKIDGIFKQPSWPVNNSVPVGNGHERNLHNNTTGVTLHHHNQGKAVGHLNEEQTKKKRKCQVCMQPDHNKRRCPHLSTAGWEMLIVARAKLQS